MKNKIKKKKSEFPCLKCPDYLIYNCTCDKYAKWAFGDKLRKNKRGTRMTKSKVKKTSKNKQQKTAAKQTKVEFPCIGCPDSESHRCTCDKYAKWAFDGKPRKDKK